ncbi:GMC family oxidoreductase [Actinotalea sp. Marseille-Q4924]|uniref:GMC family oxidoreductase n=1 Tax=Actinotalea sp. Marseille-Q4924 TaxID=2866571 RepID=UPI001CE4AFC3|nr:GMC family oxidoreductase [Actinotalea sp. Marseille-Q4924]
MHQSYDVIVVGGGSAGCAAAARLSQDAGCRVLLLEAGPDPSPLPDVVALTSMQHQLHESPYVLHYPTPRPDGSEMSSLSGRIMGGGSSVNQASVVRPPRADMDLWAALGNDAWSYDAVLPVMRRIEADQDYPDSPFHGADGPLYVKRPWTLDMPASEPLAALVERALGMGLPACPDINGPEPLGVCPSPYSIKEGQRQSSTVAYLDPARGRANLTVVAEAPVHRLTLEGGRVTGVVHAKNGREHVVAGDRVVLCAGVFHSPQILQLSGVGPEAELRRIGIPTAHALEGVGGNYQDHPVVQMTFAGGLSRQPFDWMATRLKLLVKSDPGLAAGDLHLMLGPPQPGPDGAPLVSMTVRLLQQRNRGRVRLASDDPRALPHVDARLLLDPGDVAAVRAGMGFVHELTQHPSLAPFVGAPVEPTSPVAWTQHAVGTYDTYHHGVGTCMMGQGSDPLAVVDQHLRVHGIENLWVGDASIMPTITRASTNFTAVIIGERVAEFVEAAA